MRVVLTQEQRIGVERDGGMVDVAAAFADIPFRSAADLMPRVLAVLAERRPALEALAASGAVIPLPALQAPVPRPPKVIAAVGNIREAADPERPRQDMFLQSPDAVIGQGGEVILPRFATQGVRADAALALIVGQRAKDLPADARALDTLAGYACAIDVSAEGIGRIGPPRIGASFNTFTPLGPALVTRDDVPDPQQLRVTLTINGQERQDYTTAEMTYSVVEILAFISGYMTLVPGDVILCGALSDSDARIAAGDRLEAAISQIGALGVTVGA